jgi:thioredoxin-related protein
VSLHSRALRPQRTSAGKSEDAKVEIEEAVAKANKDHQRVILVFGGNWCYDCHVLDQAFHQADVAPLLGKNFQVVHVNVATTANKITIWPRNTRFRSIKECQHWRSSVPMENFCTHRRMANGSPHGHLIPTT